MPGSMRKRARPGIRTPSAGVRKTSYQLVFMVSMVGRNVRLRLPETPGVLAMKPLVTDALWERILPLLPPHPPRRQRFPGRKPLDDRMVLTGILFVLKTGIAWDDLP